MILKINLLTKYHANLDCVNRSIFFALPRGLSFTFQSNLSGDVLLTTYVAAIEGTSSEIIAAQIPVVCEFEDVFWNIS